MSVLRRWPSVATVQSTTATIDMLQLLRVLRCCRVSEERERKKERGRRRTRRGDVEANGWGGVRDDKSLTMMVRPATRTRHTKYNEHTGRSMAAERNRRDEIKQSVGEETSRGTNYM